MTSSQLKQSVTRSEDGEDDRLKKHLTDMDDKIARCLDEKEIAHQRYQECAKLL